jgi:hypothetical protein
LLPGRRDVHDRHPHVLGDAQCRVRRAALQKQAELVSATPQRAAATVRSIASPVACPAVSLIGLKRSRSIITIAAGMERGMASKTRSLSPPTDVGLAHAECQLAQALGMPELRELVLARRIVFYAHSEREAVLPSLRNERQLAYRLTPSGI